MTHEQLEERANAVAAVRLTPQSVRSLQQCGVTEDMLMMCIRLMRAYGKLCYLDGRLDVIKENVEKLELLNVATKPS